MRRIIIALVLVAFGRAAFAADMPVSDKHGRDDCCNWTGIYAGAFAGYDWGSMDTNAITFAGFVVPAAHFGARGAFGGVRLGYNHQTALPIVLGIESDIQAANIRMEGLGTGGNRLAASVDAFASLRGRVGWAFDHALLYATAGTVWIHQENSRLALPGGAGLAPVGTLEASRGLPFGAIVGGGIEFCINRNWSVTAEYLVAGVHFDAIRPVTQQTGYFDQRLTLARAGFNYRF